MIRLATLRRVAGDPPRMEAELAAGVRVMVRRDTQDRDRWHLLATHRLVASPAPTAEPSSGRIDARPFSSAERARQAARDIIERSEGGELNDELPFGSEPA